MSVVHKYFILDDFSEDKKNFISVILNRIIPNKKKTS